MVARASSNFVFNIQVLASEDDQDALTTDPDELIDSEDSEGISGDEEDILFRLLQYHGRRRCLKARANIHLFCLVSFFR